MNILISVANELDIYVESEISAKALFHKIALKSHPDKVPGREDLFKRACQAYENIIKKPINIDNSFDDLFNNLEKMTETLKEVSKNLEEVSKGLDKISLKLDKIIEILLKNNVQINKF
jgi:uncharacterized protein YaaN involved in tellurite resistance